MLASEVIKRYEAYCPQELSMEGMSVAYRSAPAKTSIRSWWPWISREQTVAEAIAHGVDLIIVKHAPIFPSHQGFGSRSGSKSDLYRLDQA